MVYSTNTILAHSGRMIYFRENSNVENGELIFWIIFHELPSGLAILFNLLLGWFFQFFKNKIFQLEIILIEKCLDINISRVVFLKNII